ncbi:MAG: hypothetical protein CVV44_11350 [Spirochaetae bacterium HGW-Spirochaetae-1]|nr:MAG: hypothetical protein CVV44_11350 [Spirochaetae bacterium HGW-Spirochaetae-1]
MIEEKISLHGHFQFEIKQYYKFIMSRGDNSFFIRTYFFIPNNLNINEDTYSRNDFYSDLRTYIRLRTPTVYLNSLASHSDIFLRLTDSMRNTVDAFAGYEYHIKLFCLILKRSLRLQIRAIKHTDSSDAIIPLLEDYISSTEIILKKFRALEQVLEEFDGTEEAMTIYHFADEYISLKIESHAFRLIKILEGKNATLLQINRLVTLAYNETEYRKQRGYPSIPSAESNNTGFIYREGVLKKYISNVLFLETRIEREGKLLEQMVYSIAAGLAMVFATAVAFIGQNTYGNLSLPFFAALVISYMFKDRIKELTRKYFERGLKKWLYDRKRFIYHSFKNRIGFCKESFSYIPESRIPEEVMRIRKRDRFTDIDNSLAGEKVIQYRKYITISSKRFSSIKQKYTTEGIIDILRFNIEKFLRYTDDPEKKIIITENNTYKTIHGERVYHMNMITHHIIDKKDHYNKFRIIFNRSGIKNIIKVY